MIERQSEPKFDRSGGVPGGAPWERDWVEFEELHLDRPKVANPKPLTEPVCRPNRLLSPTNKLNRQANIAIAHGCWVNGVYRDNGVPRPPKP